MVVQVSVWQSILLIGNYFMKTIFISVTRATLVRNILRTGVLDKLLDYGARVVIIVPGKVHDYFRKEFNRENVIIEQAPDKIFSKFRKLFIIISNGLSYTETEKRKLKYGGIDKEPTNKIVFYSLHILFSVTSRIVLFKRIFRWAEQNIFIEKDYDYLFDKYKPDLLFCTSLYSKLDSILIKTAKRLGVISLSMPKSWDTVGRLFFRAPSDKILLYNDFMKKWVVKTQLISEDDTYVTGIPQFDIYKNKTEYLGKEEFCNKCGLDVNKPIILYASEGVWSYWDEIYVDDLINNYNILDKYNLVLRPHFSNLEKGVYNRFKKYQNIFVDDQQVRITGMFVDQWDPTVENMDWLAEVIHSSDVVVTFYSTFVLDTFAYDKPVINIFYNLESDVFIKQPPIETIYNCFHYNVVLKEGGLALANGGREVMEWIDKFLDNPKLLSVERQSTIDKLCYKLDGKASERIANIIIKYLNN